MVEPLRRPLPAKARARASMRAAAAVTRSVAPVKVSAPVPSSKTVQVVPRLDRASARRRRGQSTSARTSWRASRRRTCAPESGAPSGREVSTRLAIASAVCGSQCLVSAHRVRARAQDSDPARSPARSTWVRSWLAWSANPTRAWHSRMPRPVAASISEAGARRASMAMAAKTSEEGRTSEGQVTTSASTL